MPSNCKKIVEEALVSFCAFVVVVRIISILLCDMHLLRLLSFFFIVTLRGEEGTKEAGEATSSVIVIGIG